MDLTNFWFSSGAAGGGGGDPGDPIGQSLRFRGNSALHRDIGTDTITGDYTVSFWMKPGGPNKRGSLFSFGNNYGTGGTGPTIDYDMEFGNGELRIYAVNASTGVDSTAEYRDFSAWYNIMYVNETGVGTRVFVNGQESINTTNVTAASGNSTMAIGNIANTAATSLRFEGYMAAWYFIDGQALLPTAFGRYNDDGVWVPIEVDFTPAEMRWSDFLTATVGTIDGSNPGLATNAFDGDFDSNTGRCFTSAGGELTWAPPVDTPATFTTTLEIYNINSAGDQNITWNGNTVAPTGGWVTVFTDPDPDPANPNVIDANQPLVITATSTARRAELYAVRLDGEIVLNPYIWSADVTASGSTFSAAGQPQNAFNGQTGTTQGAELTGPGAIIWDPTPDIVVTTSIRVFTANANCFCEVNDLGSVALTQGDWTEVSNGAAFPITIETINVARSTAGSAPAVSAYEIDGQIYVDGVNPSYGANGFHLDFADPNNLGLDTSGNQNNFTATGFDTDPVGIFSNDLTTNTSFSGANPATQAFDNNTATFCLANGVPGTNTTITFAPTTAIALTSLQVFSPGFTDQTITFGGETTNLTPATTWVNIDIGTATEISSTSPLVLTRLTAGESARLIGIQINGDTVLVDNTGTDYDLMQDSPTQNYSTLNPVLEPTNQTLSDANLTGGTSSTATSLTTQLPDYQYYWEGLGSNYYYGISEIDAVRDNYLGSKANQVGWFNDGSFWVGTSNVGTFGPSFATTDVAMQAYDPATGNYWVGINGTWHGGGDPENGTNPAFTVSADFRERMLPASNVSSGTNSYNFGQQPFLFPVPDGFSALQTQNMPAAPIANGRDHFVVHLDPGAAILPAAQGLFPNGLWWIKDMVNSNQHQLVDSINGNSCVRLPGPTSPANYTAPAGDSVAWCWSTTEDWTGNGVTTNRRDPVAGFSHFNYTGNGADTRDLDHGLGTPPEFVFIFDPNANDVKCYVNGLTGTGSSTQNLILSTSEAASNVFSAGIIYRPEDNDTFTVGLSQSPTNVNSVNQNGVTYRAYCWAPVPGYSAFGSYTGNSSTDGPFIYTGFRPAWVMWKRTNSGAGNPDWYIIDSTRSPFNLASEKLAANTTDSEQNPTGENVLDFLSNGFKIRAGNQSQNATGGDFIYCAFASNPFGGSNVSPANAR
jgi:hypothetical protein